MAKYSIERYEPISSLTPADGWRAVFLYENELIEEPLIGWALTRVTSVMFREQDDGPPVRIDTQELPNEIIGYIAGDGGNAIPALEISNFRDYRGPHETLDDVRNRQGLDPLPEVVN